MKQNILIKKVEYYIAEILPHTGVRKSRYMEFDLASQCFRAATSVQANIEEANGAEGRKDFIHKLSISRKELRESMFWLKIACQKRLLTKYDLESLLLSGAEIYKLLNASITTARMNLHRYGNSRY